eukprot:CAMPEP_0118911780 /NCGR_PEP_ID=MMETSP1166-20130328/13319_1 /TAXON_ID=1104430 /ORGANISM="Chrysoreinhardia sp, Strain CCMP3193" /LENGTH=439 /DNA_ID=CAMNT_0006851287 /DNA_START=19 /DNA_END=1341 /DNA_ORIENTATION=+
MAGFESMDDPRLIPTARDSTRPEDEMEEDDPRREEEEGPPALREWDGVRTSGPVVALLIGMAGSGKSTLFHRLYYDAVEDDAKPRKRVYFVNLDPATLETPIEAHVDIRDTVDYKGVMREYSLGPNGAIVTSLNLFATQFHEVMELLEKRAKEYDYVVVDTPGQIEAFTWSASGQLVAETLASTFATTIVYVVDAPRSRAPATFMSNMVYACSILHKYQLPLIAAFNKADVTPPDAQFAWMDDFEAFHEALDDAENRGESYVTSLHRSMSLVLDEFYRVLDRVAVSAADGRGIDDLWTKLDNAREHYDRTYGNEIRKRLKERRDQDHQNIQHNMQQLRLDQDAAGTTTTEGGGDYYDPGGRPTKAKAPTTTTTAAGSSSDHNKMRGTIPASAEGDDMVDDDTHPGQPSPLPKGSGPSQPRTATTFSRKAPPAIRKKTSP